MDENVVLRLDYIRPDIDGEKHVETHSVPFHIEPGSGLIDTKEQRVNLTMWIAKAVRTSGAKTSEELS